MNPWFILALAIVSEVLGSSALKLSAGFAKPWPWLVVVIGYGAAFWLLSLVLKSIPLSTTYAVWSGVGTAGVALIGWLYFRETLTSVHLVGIALVIAGVVVLNLGSRVAS